MTTTRLTALLITGLLAVMACLGVSGGASGSPRTAPLPATAPPSSQQVLAEQNAAQQP